MINRVPALAAAGLLAAGLGAFASAAAATPLSGALAIENAVPGNIEAVRWGGGWGGGGWRGGGWRGGGWGWGVGAGIVGGAIIGGALAAPYYGYGPYYPAYPPPYPVLRAGLCRASARSVRAAAGCLWAGAGSRRLWAGPGAGAYGPGPDGGGGDPGYCAHRYRSFDPQSGTYMGTDGVRHPCP